MHIGLIIIAILASFRCIVALASEPSAEKHLPSPEYSYVDREGYRYSYTTVQTGGVIEVKEPRTNKLIARQSYLKPAGCPGSDFAEPHALNQIPDYYGELVLLCGEDKTHRSTVMLFNRGEMLAKLDYFYIKPNLVWHPEYSSYLAVVRYGHLRPGGGMDYLRMVYELRTGFFNDLSLFYPNFNAHSYPLYRDEYERLKQRGSLRYLPLLAELLATSRATLICSELGKAPLNTLTRTQVVEDIVNNESYGFPSFDPTVCERGGRVANTTANTNIRTYAGLRR